MASRSDAIIVLEAPEEEATYVWSKSGSTIAFWARDADEPVVYDLHPERNDVQSAYRKALSLEITRTAEFHSNARRNPGGNTD